MILNISTKFLSSFFLRSTRQNQLRSNFTHIANNQHVCMIDCSNKAATFRHAKASCTVFLGKEVTKALSSSNSLAKGPVLLTAEIAGIQAAKKTSELLPLCHPLSLSSISVRCELEVDTLSVKIETDVSCTDSTGVEMEALTAASVAALTIYDMCKSYTKAILIQEVKLVSKTGGKSSGFDETITCNG